MVIANREAVPALKVFHVKQYAAETGAFSWRSTLPLEASGDRWLRRHCYDHGPGVADGASPVCVGTFDGESAGDVSLREYPHGVSRSSQLS